MNNEIVFEEPAQDPPIFFEIQQQIIFFEKRALLNYLPQKTMCKVTNERTIINDDGKEEKVTTYEVLNRHSVDFVYLKSEFEKTPYCLKEFWLCDIFHSCHEIRRHLYNNELEEASQKLKKIIFTDSLFESLSKILSSYSVSEVFPKTDPIQQILYHFVTPKLYLYCYTSHNPKEHTPKFENFIRNTIRNTLTDSHRIFFLRLLKKRARNRKIWPSMRAAISDTIDIFNQYIERTLEANNKTIIRGRNDYIATFEQMQNRAKLLLKEKPWLRNSKYYLNETNNITNTIKILECLIDEQKTYLERIKKNEFIFLGKKHYDSSTLTKWLQQEEKLQKKIIQKN